MSKAKLGKGLQLLGLLVMPAAVVYGLQGGSIYDELVLFGMGFALILVGRGLAER